MTRWSPAGFFCTLRQFAYGVNNADQQPAHAAPPAGDTLRSKCSGIEGMRYPAVVSPAVLPHGFKLAHGEESVMAIRRQA